MLYCFVPQGVLSLRDFLAKLNKILTNIDNQFNIVKNEGKRNYCMAERSEYSKLCKSLKHEKKKTD